MIIQKHTRDSCDLILFWIGQPLLFILFLFTHLSATSSFAQSTQFNFEKVETKNGVFLQGVNNIMQDSFGYIWVSCSEGLFRYDGEQFQQYSNDSRKYHIPYKSVHAILGKEKGTLILAGGQLLGKFNYLTHTFDTIHYDLPDSNQPYAIGYQKIDPSGTLWVQSLVRNNSQSFQHYLYSSRDHRNLKLVKSYHTSFHNRIGISQQGVLVPMEESVIELDANGNMLNAYDFAGKSPFAPQVDSEGVLWVKDACTDSPTPNSCGLHFWDDSIYAFREIDPINNQQFGSSNFTWVDEDFIFSSPAWKSSIFLYNRNNQTLKELGKSDFNGLPFWAACYAKDLSGTYWLGGSTLMKMNALPDIKHYLKEGYGECIDKICNIKGIAEGPNGNIYISYPKNVSVLNPETDEVKLLCPTAGAITETTSIEFFDGKIVLDNLVFDPATKTTSFLRSNAVIRSIVATDQKGRLWLGIDGQPDIYIFENLNAPPLIVQNLRKYLSKDGLIVFNEILPRKDGTVWITTTNHGIFCLNENGQIMKHYLFDLEDEESLLSKANYCMVEDGQGRLWIGSAMGLSRLEIEQEKFTHYTTADGLQGTRVYSIVPEPQKGLWLGTGTGISFFDFGTSSFVNFTQKDGLLNQEYNRKSAIRSQSGRLYFGGLKGVDAFFPSELLSFDLKETLPLLLTELTYFDGEKNEVITQRNHLYELDQITLKPADKYFKLKFRLGDYRKSSNPQYSYKLEGYDEWSTPEERNELRYDDLPPGKYVLRVKAAISPGVWNQKEIAIPFLKEQYWYKTKVAIISFAALFLLATYAFYQYQLRRNMEQKEAIRLRELDAVKTRLYTNITHEFRTPLTVILGMIDNIRGFDKERSLMKRNSKNLLRLINQLLDLSKLDSGTMKMDAIQDDIINYLKYLTESFYSMAQERKIRLQFSSEIDELVMDFDEVKLQHVIYNLLSNALKFTSKGGKVLFQTSQTTKNGHDMLSIKVADNGIGIKSEKLPHIFDRFYQADNSTTRKGEGTGIGLSLTHELVQLMGGMIKVKSEEGVGTTFTIWLPIQNKAPFGKLPEEVIRRKELEKELIPDKLVMNGNKDKKWEISVNGDLPILLVIEDNEDVAYYIRSILENDYTIHWSKNGKEGIQQALELVPDIIISDVMMPEKDGYEVTQFLKNDERTSHIPIILLTAKADIDSRLEGLERGADAYLAKPFNKKELKVRLDKLVDLRKTLLSRYSQTTLPQPTSDKTFQIEDAFLQKINQIISINLANAEFSVVDFSREAGMSQSQLLRKLKALTGKSAVVYLRSIRLHRAKEILSKGELNVSEVAYEVGFKDPLYFSRAFSKEFGYPPTEVSS